MRAYQWHGHVFFIIFIYIFISFYFASFPGSHQVGWKPIDGRLPTCMYVVWERFCVVERVRLEPRTLLIGISDPTNWAKCSKYWERPFVFVSTLCRYNLRYLRYNIMEGWGVNPENSVKSKTDKSKILELKVCQIPKRFIRIKFSRPPLL